MSNHTEEEFCRHMFQVFEPVGALETGGVTRLGYTEVEDEMHRLFQAEARQLGLTISVDEAGNCFASNTDGDAYLIGSHLDSVVSGGRYDGTAGVIAGLLTVRMAREEGVSLPLRVAAWRCEESSRFGCATIGSSLVTGHNESENLGALSDKEGRTLKEVFQERGLSLTPAPIAHVKQYLELHIEQGKVLESKHLAAGIVTGIVAPHRWMIKIEGMAEHSGATPMDLRADALAAAAELILAVEDIGRREEDSVATVGIIHNEPNVMNVIPGTCEIGVDMRSLYQSHLDHMDDLLAAAMSRISTQRGVAMTRTLRSKGTPVQLSKQVEEGLMAAAEKLGVPAQYMPSGAGHDAMMFADRCPTGMVFIPCAKGISHNPLEKAEIQDVCRGAEVIYTYLKGEEKC